MAQDTEKILKEHAARFGAVGVVVVDDQFGLKFADGSERPFTDEEFLSIGGTVRKVGDTIKLHVTHMDWIAARVNPGHEKYPGCSKSNKPCESWNATTCRTCKGDCLCHWRRVRPDAETPAALEAPAFPLHAGHVAIDKIRPGDCSGGFVDVECLGIPTHVVVLDLPNNGMTTGIGSYCLPCATHTAELIRASLPPAPPDWGP